jgi:hypothetical protein
MEKRLAELTNLDAVYPEVCRALAQGPSTAAAVFRVPAGNLPVPRFPEVVAYHFGSSGDDTIAPVSDRGHPSHQGFRVSRRLLEEVRAGGRPLMTKSIFSCDTQVTTSVIDEHSPRALMCAPIHFGKDTVELLYADVPIDDRLAYSPEEMFAFVQAVVQHVSAVAVTLRSVADR